MRLVRACVALIGVALLMLANAPSVEAGDRRLAILLVDMTPDAVSNDESSTCIADLRKAVAEDYVRFTRMGETRLRKIVGATDRSKPFMSWSGQQLKAARETGKLRVDTLIAVDCRPAEHSIDMLIATYDDGTATIRIRDVALTKGRLAWLAKEVLRHAWVGFNV